MRVNTPAMDSGSPSQGGLGGRQERRPGALLQTSPDRRFEEVKDRALLRSQALAHGQHALGESGAGTARGTVRALPPEDGLAQRPLRRVVRGLDTLDPGERPQRLAVLAQVLRDLARLRDGAVDVSREQAVQSLPDRRDPAAQAVARDLPSSEAVPLLETAFTILSPEVPRLRAFPPRSAIARKFLFRCAQQSCRIRAP